MIDFFTSWWGIALLGVGALGGMAAVATMFPAVVAFLMGSKLGRAVLIVGFVTAAIGFALLIAFGKGRARELAKQKAASQQNIQNRIKTDEQVRNLSAADRREHLNKWVRDD
jgi:apolipoprotein N-acyltransferase